MKHKVYLFLFFVILFCGCQNNKKSIEIWIENNSDTNKSMEVSTFVDDRLVDKRNILKDSIADRISSFKIELGTIKQKTKAQVKFVSSLNGESTSCTVILDSINKSTLVHVNYVEKLFRKGQWYGSSDTLKKDTVVQKEFYCEILHRN